MTIDTIDRGDLLFGYQGITPIQLVNILTAFHHNQIDISGVGVFLGCLELLARREAAHRTAQKNGEKRKKVLADYRIEELADLTGLTARTIAHQLKKLSRLGILTFSSSCIKIGTSLLSAAQDLLERFCKGRSGSRSATRTIPLLRSLIGCIQGVGRSSGKILVLLALVGRCCSLKDAALSLKGAAKIEWLQEVTGLDRRTIQRAIGYWVEQGVIVIHDRCQYHLNRSGQLFEFILQPKSKTPAHEEVECSHLPPPQAEKCSHLPPPNKDRELPTEVTKYQEPVFGVCETTVENTPPTLKAIEPSDLKTGRTLSNLFEQATLSGWLDSTESNYLNFCSAAVRALSVQGARNPVGIFVRLVKGHLWHHITQGQEDAGRRLMRDCEPLSPPQAPECVPVAAVAPLACSESGEQEDIQTIRSLIAESLGLTPNGHQTRSSPRTTPD